MKKFFWLVCLVVFLGCGQESKVGQCGGEQPIKAASFTPEPKDFKEIILPGRGTFLVYTGPGQLIWLTFNEPIDSEGLFEDMRKAELKK